MTLQRILATSKGWAVASDGTRWILARRNGRDGWKGVSFVRSSRTVLARCMRRNGLGASRMRVLLAATGAKP